MTAWKRRTEKWTACWAARPPISRWPPAYFTPVKIVAVVGDDFAQEDVDLLASGDIDLAGLERVAGGKTFFWAGVYSADMNDRTTLRTDLNVFADFHPKLPESYRAAPYLLLGNIQPALQTQRARADERPEAGRRRHHELLDQRFPRASCSTPSREWDFLLINDSEARMLSGEHNLRQAAASDPGHGPAHAGDQARRVRRRFCSATATAFHRARLSAGGSLRPHRRRRLLRRRLHRLSGGAGRRSGRRPISMSPNCAAP